MELDFGHMETHLMKLSTKGRYAVHALVDIVHEMGIDSACLPENPVSLIEISERHSISRSYLEQLFMKLRRAHLVKSIRGQSGGYYLARCAHKIAISDIVDAVDEPIKTTMCDPKSHLSCQGKTSKCLTHNLWSNMEDALRLYLTCISLADVVNGKTAESSSILEKAAKDSFDRPPTSTSPVDFHNQAPQSNLKATDLKTSSLKTREALHV